MIRNILALIIALAVVILLIIFIDRFMVRDAPSKIEGIEFLTVASFFGTWLLNEAFNKMKIIGQWLRLVPGDPESLRIEPDQVLILIWVVTFSVIVWAFIVYINQLIPVSVAHP